MHAPCLLLPLLFRKGLRTLSHDLYHGMSLVYLCGVSALCLQPIICRICSSSGRKMLGVPNAIIVWVRLLYPQYAGGVPFGHISV